MEPSAPPRAPGGRRNGRGASRNGQELRAYARERLIESRLTPNAISVVGLLGSAGQVNYAASKAGLVGMARSIARELGSRSITANVVAPGFVETDMTGVLTDEQKAAIKAQVPLQRYAHVDEVAAAVTWLAGDGAAYVTGAVIPVDGGLGMGH